MQRSKKWKGIIILCFSVSLFLGFFPTKAQELFQGESAQTEIEFKTCSGFSYNFQRYTGINFLVDFLTESFIKGLVKIKTRAKELKIDLKFYCASDFIRKKAKSLNVIGKNLFIKDIPIEQIKFNTLGPVDLKNNILSMQIFFEVNLSNVTNVLNNLPKWKRVLGELELPIPPFGKTKVKVEDLKITIRENGLVQVNTLIYSLINPEAEPLSLFFTGNLVLEEEKLLVKDLESQVEDIFTKESELESSFSRFLEDLINPVFNFHKLEKKGLKIENVKLGFQNNSLVLDMRMKLLPKEELKS